MIRKLLLLALLTLPTFGAITLVQTATPVKGLTTPGTITLASTPTVGNIVVVGYENQNNAGNGVPTITDNQGNAYAVMAQTPNVLTVSATLFCAVVGVASGTFTLTGSWNSGGDNTLFASEYSGASCTLDQVATGTGGTSPFGCGSFTTLNANDLLITLINNNSGGTVTYTAPSGFTREAQQTDGGHQSGAYADQIITSTGTYTPTWVVSSNATTNCSLVALKAASGGGGTTVTGSFVVAQ